MPLYASPSILPAGGNNENEASFGWFPETLANRPLYAVDFSRLFVDVVRQVSCLGAGTSERQADGLVYCTEQC